MNSITIGDIKLALAKFSESGKHIVIELEKGKEEQENFIFILDFEESKIISAVKLLKKVRDFEWIDDKEVLVTSEEHSFYVCSLDGGVVFEPCYEGEFTFGRIYNYNKVGIFLFGDSGKKKLFIQDNNYQLPGFVGHDESSDVQ